MQTTYSKSVHLDGLVFDPNAELDLTDEQREEMESEWKDIVCGGGGLTKSSNHTGQ